MLSLEAQNTWFKAYTLAGKCNAGGMLVLNGVLLGRDELFSTKIQGRRADLAIDELVNHGFFSRHLDGALEVIGWAEEQVTKEAHRQRKSRDNPRDSHARSHAELYLKMWRFVVTNGVTRHDREYIDTPSPGVANLTSFGSSPSEGDSAQIPAWPREVILQAAALKNTAIRDWSGPERFLAARLHCLLFAGCTVQEKANRSNASKVASSFASMADDKDYSGITLSEYVSYGAKVHADRKGERWFSPWLIKGYVEFVA